MARTASAEWYGDLKSGNGSMSSTSGAFSDLAFSFKTRFEDEPGTNPEELVAAAHAGCFSMALSNELASAGLNPESVKTTAAASLGKKGDGYAITEITLTSVAKVPGADEETVREIAAKAKEGCPISQSLTADISLELTIET